MAIEKRLYTRFASELPVDLILESGKEDNAFHLQTVNLSVRGVEISCQDDVIQAIRREESWPCHCRLSFKLPDQNAPLTIKAQVVTHRRISQHHYHLALIFVELPDQKKEALEQHLLDLRFQTN